MIHEEICTYEVAKLAKEKGFPQECDMFYNRDEELCDDRNYDSFDNEIRCFAPTISLLQRWMREEKGIYIEVYVDWEDSIDYNMIRYSWKVATAYRVVSQDIVGYDKNESEVYFDTYELALEDALTYSLKNLV